MFKNPKAKFKEKTLKLLQEKIWQAEVNIIMQEEYQKGAHQKEDSFKSQAKSLEETIAGLKDSPKYEDRQARKNLETELATMKVNLASQTAEIEKSKTLISQHIRFMADMEEQIGIVKDRF